MTSINHQIRLVARPAGVPTPSDWKLTTEPVPVPDPGEFIVGVAYLSVDPAMLTEALIVDAAGAKAAGAV